MFVSPPIVSIATKTGDDGTTALMFGRRVAKTDVRVEACGAIDELNAALGLARAADGEDRIGTSILAIQKELVTLMGELAVTAEDRARYAEKGFAFVNEEAVDRITTLIDDLEKNAGLKFDGWCMPGDNPLSAALDFARTVCRRAERSVIEVAPPNREIVRYLNRLSDLCWLWARFIESSPLR